MRNKRPVGLDGWVESEALREGSVNIKRKAKSRQIIYEDLEMVVYELSKFSGSFNSIKRGCAIIRALTGSKVE